MKKNLILIITIFAATLTIVTAGQISQSYIIYQKDNSVIVRGFIDGQEKSFDKTEKAIYYAIEQLGKVGGEILLQNGDYILEDQIDLKSRISLKGSGPGTSLIMSENHKTGIAISGDTIDRAVVSNLSIKAPKNNTNTKVGILFDHCGDSQIKDVFCLGLKEYGIWVRNNSFLCEIRGCKLADIGKSAILLDHFERGGRGGDYVPNLVTNCIVYGGNIGIELKRAIVVNVVACQVYQTKKQAFYIHETSNSVILSGCRTFQIQGDAVVVEKSNELNISSNIFCWHEGHGIVLENVTWGTVTANEIIDTGSINVYDPSIKPKDPNETRQFTFLPPEDKKIELKNGIWLRKKCRGITVTGNAIFNWPVCPPMKAAIEEDKYCSNNIFSANNINFCEEGIVSNGNGSVSANNVVFAPRSYIGGRSKAFQSFDVKVTEKFIESQR